MKAKEITLSHSSLQSPVILALTPPDPPTTREILSYLHSLFHPSSKTLQQFLRNHFPISNADQQYLDNLTRSCQTCQRTNPSSNLKPTSFPTHQTRGSLLAQDWQIDYTHMPPVQRVRYLLVLVDTFLGWVEAFPLQTKELTPWPKSSLQNLSPDLACLHPYSLIMAWNLHPRSPNNFPILTDTLEISHSMSSPVPRKGRKDEWNNQRNSYQTNLQGTFGLD